MTITIWHNPECGTSRNVLALLRGTGEELRVIEYLKTPPGHDELAGLIRRMGLAVRDLLRRKGTPYAELGLDDPNWTDDQLIDLMTTRPILINRPIVVTPRGAKLCRPSDVVLDLLPQVPREDMRKEDGAPFLADAPITGGDAAFRAALRAAELPLDDLEEPGRSFFAFRTLGGVALGFGGYELLGTLALIRSVVVLPEARGKEIGRNLLALLMRRAFDDGAREAWLLTTTAAGFFQKAGFRVVARAAAPAAILATREAASLCPVSAVVLARTISL
jgi:arsenate reductase